MPSRHLTLQMASIQDGLCPLRHHIYSIWERLQASSLSIADIISLSERLVVILQHPSHCKSSCPKPIEYGPMLLDASAHLIDFIDVAWSSISSHQCYNSLDRSSNSSALDITYSEAPYAQLLRPAVDGLKNDATIGRFLLDDGERDILIQDMLRTSIMWIIEMLEGMQQRVMVISTLPRSEQHYNIGLVDLKCVHSTSYHC